MTRNFKKLLLYVRMMGYVLIPIILLMLPSDYFDTGSPKCLSIWLAGIECWGCGLTRSIMHLIHFEIADAYYFNPLGFIVFPLLAFLWVRWFLQDLATLRGKPLFLSSKSGA